MNIIRRFSAALAALSLALLAGGAAAQNVKYFTLDSVLVSGSKLTAKFTNIESGNSTFNAISLKSSGAVTFTIYGVKIDGVAVSASNISLADNNTKLIVTSLAPVKKGKTVILEAEVSAPTNGCLTWHGDAWTGSVSSPSTSFVQKNADPLTSIGTGCKLSITGITSLVRGTTPTSSMKFSLTVLVTDGNDVPVPGIAVPVMLSGSNGCSFTTNPTGTTGSAMTNLQANLVEETTACTLTATTTIPSLSGSKTLPVFDGELECSLSVVNAFSLPLLSGAPGQFDESAGGATAPGDTGFIAGVRGFDPDKGVCVDTTKLNYAVFNNIPTDNIGTMTDPLDNVVPEGFYSLTWDPNQKDPISNQTLRPIIAVIATYRPEWGAAETGLPTRQTLICTVTPCESSPYTGTGAINGPDWKPAVACLSSLVLHSSIPAGELGCLVSETWDVVPATIPVNPSIPSVTIPNPEFCVGTPPTGAVPLGGRCLKPTSIMLMGQDPVFGR